MVALGIGVLGLSPRLTEGGPAHELLDLLSYTLLIVAVLGRIWCSVYIGGRKKRELVAAGPYSIVRNPLYVFSFLGVTGIGLASGTVTLTIMLCLLFTVYYAAVVRHEERILTELFGEPYTAYIARVPRWLPKFMLWSDNYRPQVEPRVVLITMRDSVWFFIALPVFETIEYLHGLGYLPVVLNLP